ncbi:MAG: hypothetical protein CL484_13005 [Acidobacteria bacterium]|nr:hypothetical protein [Acidobacteriota bacterium]
MVQKRTIGLIGFVAVFFLLGVSGYGQDMPSGGLVRLVNCSLNEGTTMAEAVNWARNAPRDDTDASLIFFRQAIFTGAFQASSDFTIASYYPSYGEMVSRVGARGALPQNRVRPGRRASDLFTCDPSSARLNRSRIVNPDSDGFSGEGTLMSSRLCRLNEGASVADAYAFAQGIARNFAAGGDNSLMQVVTREHGPVGERVAGRGVALLTVPATPEGFASRRDLQAGGLRALQGLTLPMACDYPAMWFTHAVHRAGN